MSVHYQFGFGFGTAAQIAAYNPPSTCPYEPTYDTTNGRLVIMLGTGAGNFVAMATESYVQAQVAALSAGIASNLVLGSSCI